MQDIFENLRKINEQEDSYRNEVELTVLFQPPTSGMSGLDDDYYVDAPRNVMLTYDIEVDHRSWGIKDINVTPRGVLEFEVEIRSNLPEEEGRVETIPVRVDFSEVSPTIDWLEGSGIAPAEVRVTLGEDNKVVDVEIDFYYWKP